MPSTGDLFDDRHADPRDQAGIMDGDRLSEYVFHLIAHVNAKGLPEFADAELRDKVPRVNAWERAQAHARGCRVCRLKATNATATAGIGPGDTSLVSGSVSTHPFSMGDVGVIYPECSHSSSERGGGGGWSGGDGAGSGGGFDGGGGGFSGGGGGDCGGSSSW